MKKLDDPPGLLRAPVSGRLPGAVAGRLRTADAGRLPVTPEEGREGAAAVEEGSPSSKTLILSPNFWVVFSSCCQFVFQIAFRCNGIH